MFDKLKEYDEGLLSSSSSCLGWDEFLLVKFTPKRAVCNTSKQKEFYLDDFCPAFQGATVDGRIRLTS